MNSTELVLATGLMAVMILMTSRPPLNGELWGPASVLVYLAALLGSRTFGTSELVLASLCAWLSVCSGMQERTA